MTRPQEDLEDRLRRVLDRRANELAVHPTTWHGPQSTPSRRRLLRVGVGNLTALAGVAVAVLVAVIAVLNLHRAPDGTHHHPGAASSRGNTESSSTTTTSHPASTTKTALTVGGVERALLRQENAPRPTAAACRAPTATERAHAQIGGADSVFFSCMITLNGQPARFYVQVILSTGSFIAESESRTQQQIFGCCVARTVR